MTNRTSPGRQASLFTTATTMWTAFLPAGLPSNYFLHWSGEAQLWLIVILPTIALFLITWRRARGLSATDALIVACVTAFYFTVPFFVYDWLYLGLHKNLDWSFLRTHWDLTSFYATPWLALPLIVLLPRPGASSPSATKSGG